MKTSRINSNPVKSILVITFLTLLLTSCGFNRLQIAEFDFVYNGTSYTVRSAYCPNNPKSCNHLIGDDFVAVDMNQDRIMDKVSKGNIELSRAQLIYDYCLNQLELMGKINEVGKKSIEYVLIESDYTFKIKSLSNGAKPFNQFTIEQLKSVLNESVISIFNDDNADGTLNEFLKGGILLDDAQKMYSRTIEKGLVQEKLYKVNNNIFVK